MGAHLHPVVVGQNLCWDTDSVLATGGPRDTAVVHPFQKSEETHRSTQGNRWKFALCIKAIDWTDVNFVCFLCRKKIHRSACSLRKSQPCRNVQSGLGTGTHVSGLACSLASWTFPAPHSARPVSTPLSPSPQERDVDSHLCTLKHRILPTLLT